MTAGVGDRQPVIGMIGDAARHRIVGGTIGEANNSGGESEQVEQPDHGQKRKQPKDIGLRLGMTDAHERDRGRDDAARYQQDQNNAAAAPRRLVGGRRWRRNDVRFGGHMNGRSLSA